MERLEPIGRFLFRFRGWIFPVVVVLALLLSRPRHLLGDAGLDRWMDLAGSIVALLGLAVRAVTIGYEYIVRGGRNRQVYADDLVQGGIYALTRNPMYLGNGLLVIGCAMILNAPAFYLVAVPVTFFAYAAIIAAEESYLRTKFGTTFDAYCARVNRIVPRLAGFRRAVAGMRFNWRRLVVKEYNTFFWAVAQIGALCFLDDYLIDGSQGPEIRYAPWALAFWIAAYLTVWSLKKTGRLRAESPEDVAGRQATSPPTATGGSIRPLAHGKKRRAPADDFLH
jgi:protein-S-isoprenylcysteine O-methyltransferase Ste14